MILFRLYRDATSEYYLTGFSHAHNPCVVLLENTPPLYDPPRHAAMTAVAWSTVDVSANIPADATGVIVRGIVATTPIFHYRECGIRRFGSADVHTFMSRDGGGFWAHIGVDSGRFQGFIQTGANPSFWDVYGYTTGNVEWNGAAQVFASNPGAWRVCDTGRTDAIAAFVLCRAVQGRGFGIRPFGTAYAWQTQFSDQGLFLVIPLDAGRFEFYHQNADNAYVQGYILDGATVFDWQSRHVFNSISDFIDDPMTTVDPYDAEPYTSFPFGYISLVPNSLFVQNRPRLVPAEHWIGTCVMCPVYVPVGGSQRDALLQPGTGVVKVQVLQVVTNPATDVAGNSARLNGAVTDAALGVVLERGFDQWVGGAWHQLWSESGVFGIGAFSWLWPSLQGGTTYTFRAKARNASGWSFGLPVSFTTLNLASYAVDTLPATSVVDTRARLNGMVLQSLGNIVSVGFEYGSSLAYGSKTQLSAGFSTGLAFYADIAGLPEGTIHHYRAYLVTPSRQVVYGPDKTFGTLSSTGPVTWVDEETLLHAEGGI